MSRGRPQKVADLIQRELSDLLRRDVRDPRVGMVTLTAVDVAPDLSHAKVFYSTLALETPAHDEALPDHVAAALESASSHLRGAVGRQLRIHKVPALHFSVDPGIVAGQRVEEILRGTRLLADEEFE